MRPPPPSPPRDYQLCAFYHGNALFRSDALYITSRRLGRMQHQTPAQVPVATVVQRPQEHPIAVVVVPTTPVESVAAGAPVAPPVQPVSVLRHPVSQRDIVILSGADVVASANTAGNHSTNNNNNNNR